MGIISCRFCKFSLMSKTYHNDKLIAKVKADKNLTRDEEIYYLMNLLNHTREEAEYVINFSKIATPRVYPHIMCMSVPLLPFA
jgi:hypothetical protein